MKALSKPQIAWGFGLSAALGATLAVGFLPMVSSLAARLGHYVPAPTPVVEMATYLALTGLFILSLPKRLTRHEDPRFQPGLTLILPLFIAVAFGWCTSARGLLLGSPVDWNSLAWLLIISPVAEEWLFRGWLLELLETVFPRQMLTLTNPLPASVVFSSLAFSLWHVQNLGALPTWFVGFQICYSFFLGIWFGFLRLQTGKLWWPVAAHCAVNVGAALL